MTKQETYNTFILDLKLLEIFLKQHSFRLMRGFKFNTHNQVNIKHKLIKIKPRELDLIIDFGFDVICTREDTSVWKSEYVYNVVLRFSNTETINSVIDDEELKSVFINNQMIKFLWSYLRQELQSDTVKAGIPAFILPARK